MSKWMLTFFCCLLLSCNNSEDEMNSRPKPEWEYQVPEINVTSGDLNTNGDTIVIFSQTKVSLTPSVTDEQERNSAGAEKAIIMSGTITHYVKQYSWFSLIKVYDKDTQTTHTIILCVSPNDTGKERRVPLNIDYALGFTETNFVQK